MIKVLLKFLTRKTTSQQMTQDELLDFVLDKKTIERAAEGSMKKRNDLLNRVELSRRTPSGDRSGHKK